MNPWASLRGLRREIWILCTATLINRAGTMVLPFLVLYLTVHMGFSATRASLALSVYGVGSLISGPFAGLFCDRFGSLRVMKVALFWSGLLMLPLPLIKPYWAILAVIFAWSVIAEAFRPANLASLSDFARTDQRRAAFALNRLSINLGMSIGPAAGGLLAAISFPALFGVNGVTTLLSATVLALYLRSSRALPEPGEEAENSRPESGTRAIRNPRFIYFLAAFFPAAVVFFQLMSTMPLFLVRGLGLHESAFGLLLTVNTGIIILVEVPLNAAMGAWRHGRALALGALLVGAGFGAMVFARGFWSTAATVVVWTFGEMILLPSSAAFVADLSPEGRRGEYMGFYQAVFSLSLISGPWLGTKVLEAWGGEALWTMAFMAGALSAILLWSAETGMKPTSSGPGRG